MITSSVPMPVRDRADGKALYIVQCPLCPLGIWTYADTIGDATQTGERRFGDHLREMHADEQQAEP